MFRQKLFRSVTLLTVATAVTLAMTAVPAQAGFQQEWYSAASYRASADFIPTSSTLTKLAAFSCDPNEPWYNHYKYSLVKTSNSSEIWKSPWVDTYGQWREYFNIGTPYANQAHYMRWWNQRYNTVSVATPCQSLLADW